MDMQEDDAPKRGPGRPPKAKPGKIAFSVQRDFWGDDGARVRAGTIVELFAEDALPGVEAGALRRV